MPGKDFYRWQVRSFTVLLALDAIDRINQALRDPKIDPSEEQGGLLFGRRLDDHTIEVTDFELVRSGHRRGISYDLSPHERNRFAQRVWRLRYGKGPRPVGCFRTHLRPGLFLDLSDVALLTQTFDESGIILTIRVNQQGLGEAGIFFRENDDIDGKQPGLKFPFDAEALRVQGPIEEGSQVAAPDDAKIGWNPRSVNWRAVVSTGVYVLAGAILAVAMIAGMYHRDRRLPDARTSPVLSAAGGAAIAGESEFLAAPPAVFDDEPLNSAQPENADTASLGFRTPFGQPPVETPQAAPPAQPSSEPSAEPREDAPPFREAAPPAAEHAADPPPPDPLPVSPRETTLLSANLPAVVSAPPARGPVSVDVSIEPKEDGALKRAARSVPAAMGHVPLLGRLPGLRRDHDQNVVAARPYEDLSPRIPADVRRNLAEQVEVDVDASIDDQGEVTNTEIVRGDDPQLSALAENAVRASRWKPARSGDRNVGMSVVVHYRFSPGREP